MRLLSGYIELTILERIYETEMKLHILNLLKFALYSSITFVFVLGSMEKAHAQSVDGFGPFIKEMKSNHPGLEAQKLLIESLGELPEAQMAWADPMIGIGLMNVPSDSFAFDQEGMTQKVVSVTQKVPSYDKRRAKRDMASADVEVAKAKLTVATAQLIAKLKKTVYEISFVKLALEILSNNEMILDDFVRIANMKYATGKGIQANVIMAQVERSKLIDKKLKLKERLKLGHLRLNRMLGREPNAEVSTSNIKLMLPGDVSFKDEWEKARLNSPIIVLKQKMTHKAAKHLQKAESSTGLDMMFMLQYGQREDSPMERADFISAKVGMTVPLWKSSKQDKFIVSARARLESANMFLRDTEEKIKSDLAQKITSLMKERETIDLYEHGILPQAAQALASARAAYRLDRVDFLTMLKNELTLLRYELELVKAKFILRKLSAEIEFIKGSALMPGGANG